ncbi:MAG: LysR family transcriptional regulator [Pseudomonadota bacterium]|nr:LysR family transcriptional regulator [Pseudomonadota bacterium]
MRLLTIFEEIYKTKSVTRTGQNLDLPQTSVSLALGRLRQQFNDPLFVRTSKGMEPTPHARELVKPLRQALQILQAATRQQVVFDPARSERKFRISMTDFSHLEFLPSLINRVNELAPSVQIEILRITPDTASLLESGDSDLAVGFMPELEAGFFQQNLFQQNFACVVRKAHPRIGARMTEGLYKRERHVVVTAAGTGQDLVDKTLTRQGIQREIALTLPTLPGLGNLLANTDLVATVPVRVAQTLVRIAQVKLLAPPIAFPSFMIKQHWHERYQHDPANRWLRSQMADLFQE